MGMTKADNGTYIGGEYDVIAILTNPAQGTYRAAFLEAVPLPGKQIIKDNDPCRRLKTHYLLKPDCTDDLEEAKADLERLVEIIRLRPENIWRDELIKWQGVEPFTTVV